jgi:hypothetical protein
MKTLKLLHYTSVASLTLAMFTAVPSIADTLSAETAATGDSGNLVHRVSRSLAGTQTYTSNVKSSYKWGTQTDDSISKPRQAQAKTESIRGGYKWGDSSTASPQVPSYAGAAAANWGTKSYADEARNKWGLRNFSDQSRNKWGLRNFSDQSRNKWGLR